MDSPAAFGASNRIEATLLAPLLEPLLRPLLGDAAVLGDYGVDLLAREIAEHGLGGFGELLADRLERRR